MRNTVIAMSLAWVAVCTTDANAQNSANSQSAFCQTASQALLVDSTPETIARVKANCRPGDIISIPGNTVRWHADNYPAVQRLCDFSKSLYVAPSGLMSCVMVGERPSR